MLSMTDILPISASEKPKIGEVKSEIFDNGLRIYVRENHESPTVSLQVWVKTGSIHEGKNLGCGLSHFLEHMMFEGSKNYSRDRIADLVHRNGGDTNAYTSYGHTVYYIDILSEAADKAIDILSDVISSPVFPSEEFAKEKDVIIRERAIGEDNPENMLGEKLWLTMFLDHPVRHTIIGYKEKIVTVNREMMLEYYKERYSPERVFFVIAGDVDAAHVISRIKEKLGKWEMGRIEEPPLPEERNQICPRSLKFHFKDPLARLAVGFHVPEASHPDTPALDLLAVILGQNRSSRLVNRLRDERQIAIHIDAFNYTPYFCGVFTISAVCAPEKIDELKAGIFEEIEKVKDEVSDCELKRVVKQAVTAYFRELRSNSNVARIIGDAVLTYGAPDYADKYLDDISKVTADDIREAARKYLTSENSTVVELLPEKDAGGRVKRIKGNTEKNRAHPDIMMKKLDSGQKIIALADDTLPLVDICVVFPGGGIMEDKENSGITRLVASLLTAGTASMPEKELLRFMDDNAISLSISSGNNTLTLQMNFHKSSIEPAFSILSSILSEPVFPKKQFLRERENAISSLRSMKLSPQNAAEFRLRELLYGSHPYACPSVGLEESIKHLTVEKIKNFYFKTCLVPEKTVFAIAGDIDKNDLFQRITDIISNIPWNTTSKSRSVKRPVFLKSPIKDEIHVPREQAVVMLGFPSCDNNSDDRFAIDIVRTSFNGMASRLFKTIREKNGLAYYTGLYSSLGLHEGFLAFYAGTHPDKAGKTAALLDNERRLLVENKALTGEEFKSAKACIQNELAEQKLNIQSLILNSALSEFYGNGYLHPWEIEEIYSKLSLEETNRVIKKYLDTDAFITVIAGP